MSNNEIESSTSNEKKRKRVKEEEEEEELGEISPDGSYFSPPMAPRHPSQNDPLSQTFTEEDLPLTPNTVTSPPPPSGQENNLISSRSFKGCSKFDDYEPIKKIGEGTFGEVSTAKHKPTGRTFALKKILMHNEKEGMPITALREIRILKALKHPNVISLFEIAFQKGDRQIRRRGSIYMVFPYMDHDLSGLLDNKNVRITAAQIKSYFQQLLRAVEYLHSCNILHRDMKTSNILIDNQGNLKLADFGLARDFERDNKEREYTNMVVTRWYRPPELFMGAVKYDESVDMWGVGCVFGELLKRRPILTGQSDIDQLEKIFMLCGTPTMADWPEHINLPAYKSTISAIKSSYSKSFSERFSSLHKEEANLLELFLEMNPLKRISAKKALEHEYFITYPLPAQPGSKDFSPFPTSHEYQTRQERHKAEAEAEAKRASTTRNDGNWRGKDRREYDGRWKDERDSRDANRYNKRDNRYEHNRYSSNSRGSATECLTYPSKKKLH